MLLYMLFYRVISCNLYINSLSFSLCRYRSSLCSAVLSLPVYLSQLLMHQLQGLVLSEEKYQKVGQNYDRIHYISYTSFTPYILCNTPYTLYHVHTTCCHIHTLHYLYLIYCVTIPYTIYTLYTIYRSSTDA